jgi:hypothetical protein
MSCPADEDLDWLRDGGHHGPREESESSGENSECGCFTHVCGGSDSRANWVSGCEFQQKGNSGCLTMIVGGVSILGGLGYGIYEVVRYISS